MQLQLRGSITLQLQLQLHHTALHPPVVGEVTDQVASATIVTIPRNKTPTPVNLSVDSLRQP